MHIAVLGYRNSWYTADLERAATARGHSVKPITFPDLTATIPGGDRPPVIRCLDDDLTTLDAVIVRTMPPGSLEQVVYRMDALARLEAGGVLVLNNPKAIECAVDKYLATAKLHAAGLPVPETFVCENSEAAQAAFERLGGDVVVKPLFGAEGRGIVRVSDTDLAFRTFRTIERTQSVLYLQQYIDHGGRDLRVLLLDGEVIGAMRRENPGDFRVNVSRQAKAVACEVGERERELAKLAATATDCTFCGVDLLHDADGVCYVIEVNAVPGWRAFGRATGIDVASAVVGYLENP